MTRSCIPPRAQKSLRRSQIRATTSTPTIHNGTPLKARRPFVRMACRRPRLRSQTVIASTVLRIPQSDRYLHVRVMLLFVKFFRITFVKPRFYSFDLRIDLSFLLLTPYSLDDVSTGRNVVSAALTDATCIAQGPTVGDAREESGFVRGSEEGKAPENDRRTELLPPVPPKSPLRLHFASTSSRTPHPPLPEVSAARSPVTVPSVSRSFQRRVRSHAYASSDPGHGATVIPPHSLQHKPPLVLRPPGTATTTRTRTMPGYRTSHFPSLSSPSGTYLTPNSEAHGSYLAERYRYGPLDAILESMQHVEQGNYEHSAVYTGIIAGPSDVVFPRFRGVQVPKPSQGFSPSSDFASASTSTITDSGKRRNKLRKRKPITAAGESPHIYRGSKF